MGLRYLTNRLFHRDAWMQALERGGEKLGYRALSALSAQVISMHYAAIIQLTGEIHSERDNGKSQARAAEVLCRMEQLQKLLPYAAPAQRRQIADAQRTAQYAQSIAPPLDTHSRRTEITYYSVCIPAMNGHFYYLGTQPYHPGDVVVIPFGGENKLICGIVEEVFRRDYWKMPLPLWKMKYIDAMAPQEIAEEYERQCGERR